MFKNDGEEVTRHNIKRIIKDNPYALGIERYTGGVLVRNSVLPLNCRFIASTGTTADGFIDRVYHVEDYYEAIVYRGTHEEPNEPFASKPGCIQFKTNTRIIFYKYDEDNRPIFAAPSSENKDDECVQFYLFNYEDLKLCVEKFDEFPCSVLPATPLTENLGGGNNDGAPGMRSPSHNENDEDAEDAPAGPQLLVRLAAAAPAAAAPAAAAAPGVRRRRAARTVRKNRKTSSNSRNSRSSRKKTYRRRAGFK